MQKKKTLFFQEDKKTNLSIKTYNFAKDFCVIICKMYKALGNSNPMYRNQM